MHIAQSYQVLEQARQITGEEGLEHLASRTSLGMPLADHIHRWLREQPTHQLVCLDFTGIRTMNDSVTYEVGPFVMEAVAHCSIFEHRYPIFGLDDVDIAYSLALCFAHLNRMALGIVHIPIEREKVVTPIAQEQNATFVVLGSLSSQNEQILKLAQWYVDQGISFTSEKLQTLEHFAQVSAAARSKRLTELYAHRLLAFRENPRHAKERLFLPAWRL